MIRRMFSFWIVACGVLASPGPATIVLAQEVEIISGATGRIAPKPAGAGIRTIAFVQLEPRETVYAVMLPIRADEILSIQDALASAGHDPVSRDGMLGPSTTQALTAFQTERGLEPCGCPDYPTVISLGLTPRVVQTVIGRPEDEGYAEFIVPPGRLSATPATSPPPAPPVDTVRVLEVAQPYWWLGGSGLFAGFPAGRFGPASDMSTRGGIPIGPGVKLGRPSSLGSRRPPGR